MWRSYKKTGMIREKNEFEKVKIKLINRLGKMELFKKNLPPLFFINICQRKGNIQ